MRRSIFGIVAIASLVFATSAMAQGYRVGIYGGFGPYYPVYRPYYYGPPPIYYPPPPAYYYPPPPVYRVYPPYPGVGFGYFSPRFSVSVGR